MVSVTGDSIEIRVNPSLENNGSPIVKYRIYMDDGTLDPQSFLEIKELTDISATYTITQSVEGIQAGSRYRIMASAENALGESSLSPEVLIFVGSPPAQPNSLFRVEAISSRTQLTVGWEIEDDTEIPITGYILEWDSGVGDGDFSLLWNGTGRPDILSYSVPSTTA